MADMEFTMLSTELRREPRWRLLEDHPTARLIYLSFMTSSLVSYTGFFQVPIPVFSYESMIPKDRLLIGLSALEKSGMIEFDEASETVRIDGWFNERRTPDNRNQLKASIDSYAQVHLPRNEIMARSVAELTLAALKKSRTFRTKSNNPEASRRHRIKYVGEVLTFLEQGLHDIAGLEVALQEVFSGSDPRLRAYAKEITDVLPSLRLAETTILPDLPETSRQETSLTTLSKPLPDPLETLSKGLANGSETVAEEEEQRYILSGDKQGKGPLKSTIASTLAVEARRS